MSQPLERHWGLIKFPGAHHPTDINCILKKCPQHWCCWKMRSTHNPIWSLLFNVFQETLCWHNIINFWLQYVTETSWHSPDFFDSSLVASEPDISCLRHSPQIGYCLGRSCSQEWQGLVQCLPANLNMLFVDCILVPSSLLHMSTACRLQLVQVHYSKMF